MALGHNIMVIRSSVFFTIVTLNSALPVGEWLGCYKNQKANDECPNGDISLWFYTQHHSMGQEITEDNQQRLPIQTGPWKILFHGFMSSKDTTPNPELLDAYSSKGKDMNIIVADYAKPYEDRTSYKICYTQCATDNMRLVAKCIANQLEKLMDLKVIPASNDLHFIGHSLGAHTASMVANILRKRNKGILRRLTGLDPAGPLFSSVVRNMTEIVDASDAQFVDIHHTDVGTLTISKQGTDENLGNVDIWYNGGKEQPGCNSDSSCNHKRAVDYYAESIFPAPPENRVFLATPKDLKEPKVLIGEDISFSLKGVYEIETNAESPFAKS